MQVHRLAAARRRRRISRRSFPVQVTQVDPLLLAASLGLADNDPSRLQILGPDTVLVRNRPRGAAS